MAAVALLAALSMGGKAEASVVSDLSMRSVDHLLSSTLDSAVLGTQTLDACSILQDCERRVAGVVPAIQVAQRRRHRGHRHRHRGGRHHRNRGFNGNVGAGVAAGVAGAIIGGIIADSARRNRERGNAHVEWCLDRYRSYNPRTDTYISRRYGERRCRSPFN